MNEATGQLLLPWREHGPNGRGEAGCQAHPQWISRSQVPARSPVLLGYLPSRLAQMAQRIDDSAP
jgi:hypothetical protein